MKEMVFCKQCAHVRIIDSAYISCTHILDTEKRYSPYTMTEVIVYAKPHIDNIHNNCPHFLKKEPCLLQKILHKLIG